MSTFTHVIVDPGVQAVYVVRGISYARDGDILVEDYRFVAGPSGGYLDGSHPKSGLFPGERCTVVPLS